MNKSVLVIDTPKDCCTCELRVGLFCPFAKEQIAEESSEELMGYIFSRCPLKSLPEPKFAEAIDDDVKWGECIGWNSLLDELLGEEND